jgi:hypothetical protein
MNNNYLSEPLNSLSITFYSFHLRNNINYGEKPVSDADKLWQQLTYLGHTLNIPELKTLASELICYENNQYKPELENRVNKEYSSLLHHQAEGLDFSISVANGIKINGFIIPFLLHDTYATDLTLTSENPLNPDQLQAMNLFSDLQPSLGQSLLVYAQPNLSLDDYNTLANTCANQIFDKSHNLEESKVKSSLLKCPIFVYENGENDPSKHCHIIIWFNPNSTIPEQIDQVNEYLLYLLLSRHKILYAYHQSRICVANLKKEHTEIEQKINKFSQIAQSNNRLKQFKMLLIQLPQKSLQYSQLLRELSDHYNTIQVNEKNYRKFITKIETLPNSDSNFLQAFLDQVNDKFKPQIEADISFLSPANKLFEELINNIRGIVAIDQIQSDRKFKIILQKRDEEFEKKLQEQNQKWLEQLREQDEKNADRDKKNQSLIAFFGTAFAVSGVSAGAISQPGKTLIETLSLNNPVLLKKNNLLTFIFFNSFDIVFHIIVGILVAIPVFYWFKTKNKDNKKK